MLDTGAIKSKLETLVVFRAILSDPVLQALIEVIDKSSKTKTEHISAYAEFSHRLFENGGDLGLHIKKLVLSDENAYVKRCMKSEPIPGALSRCVERELAVLGDIAALDMRELALSLGCGDVLPAWESAPVSLACDYMTAVQNLSTRGFGIFAEHVMFVFKYGKLIPVRTPDPVTFSDFVGYERQRSEAVANVRAFLAGKTAVNMLLYGDAGTGKSSTVKAITNEFCSLGLRLVEVQRDDLYILPELLMQLAENPLKFIIFIDDLSFAENSAELGPLKAILEGSAAARSRNTLICATSNRRHLIRETFSERGGDDVNRNETIQEQLSLSERFGLAISFFKPDRDEYLHIVRELAAARGIGDMPNLDMLAEQHAQRHGGRSARAAHQFVDMMVALR
jgi:Predicted ATPase (AAA+ superfamily)